jgi:hypothetical protein
MKRTAVRRVDKEFADILEDGRRMYQVATGKRISTPVYTSELAQVMRPFIGIGKQPITPRLKRKP